MDNHGSNLREARKMLVVGWTGSEVPRPAGRSGRQSQHSPGKLGVL